MRWQVLVVAAVLGAVTGCGSVRASSTHPSSSDFAPFSRTAPAALGSGLVCGVAADRVLGIADHIDVRRFDSGRDRPRSAAILEQLPRLSAGSERTRASGLIVGQCAAYGFYITTYQECLRPTISRGTVPAAAVRMCIDRRRWTWYTQQ